MFYLDPEKHQKPSLLSSALITSLASKLNVVGTIFEVLARVCLVPRPRQKVGQSTNDSA